ncbi:MAG: type II toxin-antitoxin system prevent-host-death family antitoxin, partial [Acidimicrobiales bacterium]
VAAEWADRSGPPSAAAEGLLSLARLRAECLRTGITDVAVTPRAAALALSPRATYRWSMTKSVGVHTAKMHLSRLLDDVVAGEEVVVTRRGEPVARPVAVGARPPRTFGADRGRLVVPPPAHRRHARWLRALSVNFAVLGELVTFTQMSRVAAEKRTKMSAALDEDWQVLDEDAARRLIRGASSGLAQAVNLAGTSVTGKG